MSAVIKECHSCKLCELSMFKKCRECGAEFCMNHYITHMEDAHGYKMHITIEPKPPAVPSHSQQQDTQQERGLVIMSVLINFIDWLDREQSLDYSEGCRGELVKQFLAAHHEGEHYFYSAEQIAEMLAIPFRENSNGQLAADQGNFTLSDVLWAAANFITKPTGRDPQDREVVLKGLGWAVENYAAAPSQLAIQKAAEKIEQMYLANLEAAGELAPLIRLAPPVRSQIAAIISESLGGERTAAQIALQQIAAMKGICSACDAGSECSCPIARARSALGGVGPERGPSRERLRNQASNLIEGVFTGDERQSMSPVKLLMLHERIETALAAAFNSGDFRAGVAACVRAIKSKRDAWAESGKYGIVMMQGRAAAANEIITALESLTDSVTPAQQGEQDWHRCPECGKEEPQDVPGPPRVPDQWYCVNHRHLKPKEF